MKEYERHPLSELFPVMSDAEIDELADDIKSNGQREKALVLQGKILDGWNRYLACRTLGIELDVKEIVPFAEDPVAVVRSLNLKRRHLTTSQRAMIAAELVEVAVKNDSSQSSIEKELAVSHGSIQQAKTVRKKGAPELVEAVKKGKVKVSTASHVVKLAKSRQRKLVKAGKKAIQKAAAKIKEKIVPRGGLYAATQAQKQEVKQESKPTEVVLLKDRDPQSALTQHVIQIVRDCYEANKAKWNALPPPAPTVIVEAICKALKENL